MAKRVCAMIAVIVAFAAPIAAQTAASGTVEGIVKDPTGGVLPGVTVIVRNMETNVARETVTDEGGRYRAAALQPGRYEVSAELAGFEGSKISDVIVQVGQNVPIDVQMRPAGVSETLTVSGESPVIDIARTDVSNVVGQTAIPNLPDQRPPLGELRPPQPGRHQRRQLRAGQLSRHLRACTTTTRSTASTTTRHSSPRRAGERGRPTRSARPPSGSSRSASATSPPSSAAPPAARSTPSRSPARTRCTARASTSCATTRSRRASRSTRRRKPEERRQQFGVSVGGPSEAGQGVLLRQLRPAAARLSLASCAPASATFLDQRLHGSGLRLDARIPREPERRSSRARATTGSSSARWTAALSTQAQALRAVQPAPLGVAERHPDAADPQRREQRRQRHATSSRPTSRSLTLNSVLQQQAPQRVPRAGRARLRGAGAERASDRHDVQRNAGIAFGMPNFLPRPKYPNERRYQFLDNLYVLHRARTASRRASTSITSARTSSTCSRAAASTATQA